MNQPSWEFVQEGIQVQINTTVFKFKSSLLIWSRRSGLSFFHE